MQCNRLSFPQPPGTQSRYTPTMEDMQASNEAYKRELEKIRRTAKVQRLWWFAVFLLGAGLGFAVAEMLIDPVSVYVPPCQGIQV